MTDNLRTRIIAILATQPTAGLIDALTHEIRNSLPYNDTQARTTAELLLAFTTHHLEDK